MHITYDNSGIRYTNIQYNNSTGIRYYNLKLDMCVYQMLHVVLTNAFKYTRRMRRVLSTTYALLLPMHRLEIPNNCVRPGHSCQNHVPQFSNQPIAMTYIKSMHKIYTSHNIPVYNDNTGIAIGHMYQMLRRVLANALKYTRTVCVCVVCGLCVSCVCVCVGGGLGITALKCWGLLAVTLSTFLLDRRNASTYGIFCPAGSLPTYLLLSSVQPAMGLIPTRARAHTHTHTHTHAHTHAGRAR